MVQVGDKSYEVRVIESGAETGTYVLELAGERIPVTVSDVSRGGGARREPPLRSRPRPYPAGDAGRSRLGRSSPSMR